MAHDIVVRISNDTLHTAAVSPPVQYKDLYPDPPPSYEEYCSEIADDGQGQTSQEPILTQPHSHTVQVLVTIDPTSLCNHKPGSL